MSDPTFGIPSPTLAPVNGDPGLFSNIWYSFFTRLAQLSAERPIAPITPDGSPFVFTATTIGSLMVHGGTVSAVVLDRSGVDVTTARDVFIPMAANDTVTVTYSVAPTITFIPSARA